MYDGGGNGGGTACRAPGMPIGSELGERRWCCEMRMEGMEGLDDMFPRTHQRRSTTTTGTGKVNCHEGSVATCSQRLHVVCSWSGHTSALSPKAKSREQQPPLRCVTGLPRLPSTVAAGGTFAAPILERHKGSSQVGFRTRLRHNAQARWMDSRQPYPVSARTRGELCNL